MGLFFMKINMKKVMKHTLYSLSALLALAVGACANDDTISLADSNEISFDVVANATSRSITNVTPSTIKQSSSQFTDFYVYATHYGEGDTERYIRDLNVSRSYSSSSKKWSDWLPQGDAKYYWPNNTDYLLRFYAFSGFDMNTVDAKFSTFDNDYLENQQTFTIDNITLNQDANQQYDMVYAVTDGLNKGSNSGKVPLKFSHACAAVEFEMTVKNPTIYIYVKSVAIKNITNSGSFSFGIKDVNDDGDEIDAPAWTLSTKAADYKSFVKNSFGADNSADDINDIDALPKAYIDFYEGKYWSCFLSITDNGPEGIIFVIPQHPQTGVKGVFQSSAWAPDTDTDTYDETTGCIMRNGSPISGTYIEIEVAIYNLSNSPKLDTSVGSDHYEEGYSHWDKEYSDNGFTPIYGSIGNYKKILVPVTPDWSIGKLYYYNLIFDDNTSSSVGYMPDDGSISEFKLTPFSLQITSYDAWNDAVGGNHFVKEEKQTSQDTNN